MNAPHRTPRRRAPGRSPRSAVGPRGSTSPLMMIVVGLLVLTGAAGFWLGFGDDDEGRVDPDRIVVAEQRDLLDAVNSTGRIEPLARVAVMSRASGILEKLLVEEGDVVTQGQVLAELDREQLAAQLAQGEADLASAEARVLAAEARLEEARVALENPELEFKRREVDRMEHLRANGDVSAREHDDALSALRVVEHGIRLAEAQIPVLEAAVAEARANLASAKADVDRSRTALKEATIASPIDGVVLVRDKEVGDGVSSILTAGGNATQVMMLGDLSEMFVEARVDEVDLGRITVGMPALVTVDAHRGREFSGRVERIAPAGSVDNNGIVTFEVRVTVDDPERVLRPDMTAEARLVLGRRDGAVALPQRAVTRGAGNTWWVQKVSGEGEDARAERVEVTLGLSDGLMTEILSGLSAGDRVALPGGGAPQGFGRP